MTSLLFNILLFAPSVFWLIPLIKGVMFQRYAKQCNTISEDFSVNYEQRQRFSEYAFNLMLKSKKYYLWSSFLTFFHFVMFFMVANMSFIK
jgi:hypothetical protein